MLCVASSLVLIALCFACQVENTPTDKSSSQATDRLIEKAEFQSILDTAQLQGAILIFDPQEKVYYSNDFTWCKKGQLPASTFKIPNSIIALEMGIVQNERSLFSWNGESRAQASWEQDLIFRDAFQLSCVPCYQEVARDIGADSMRAYVNKLDYGAIDVSNATIDNFWLIGTSKITPFQQIDFLQRLYKAELPITQRTMGIIKSMMIIEEQPHYQLSGKTGWSISDGQNNGWFVGYVKAANQVYFFATNVEPQENFNMALFPPLRKEVTYQALNEIGVIR